MQDMTPILNALKAHDKLGRSSFHTPGHKCSGFLPAELLRLDYTELPDTDALFEASGAILESERMLSSLFGAGRSLISAGGCTLAIQTMLALAAERGKKVLMARNSHRSAVAASALLGLESVWLYPRGAGSFTGRIEPEDVRSALECDSEINACYITSPTYYGELSDIRAISRICREHNALLLVDNAHGSHLAFMREDMHPLHLGADMTACSLHKTLPVLTGGALLNLRDGSLGDRAKAAMSLFGSTSPSYPIMCSIELCAEYLRGGGAEEYARLTDEAASLRELAASRGIALPNGSCDPLRLTLGTYSAGLCGEEQQRFFEDHGIDCEFCDGSSAVMIMTPFNSRTDLDRVRRAIEEMPVSSPVILPEYEPLRLEQVISVRDAVFSRKEAVPVNESVGRIAADIRCPCPPGVPVVMPGELITRDAADALLRAGIKEVTITV